ncbi:MAG: hypothetical protein AAF244_05340 [Pseudomonadota bacterium]
MLQIFKRKNKQPSDPIIEAVTEHFNKVTAHTERLVELNGGEVIVSDGAGYWIINGSEYSSECDKGKGPCIHEREIMELRGLS